MDIKQNSLRDFHLVYHISRYQRVDFILETLVGVNKIIIFGNFIIYLMKIRYKNVITENVNWHVETRSLSIDLNPAECSIKTDLNYLQLNTTAILGSD